MRHIAHTSTDSPYISFSHSFGVARAYGLVGRTAIATASAPGYVYRIEVSDKKMVKLIDPVRELLKTLPEPHEPLTYQHDGGQNFLRAVLDGDVMRCRYVAPPGAAVVVRTPTLSDRFATLARALRDAEVLVLGNVPASMVRNRFEVS